MKKIITIYALLLTLVLSKIYAQTVCMNDTIIPIANMPSQLNDVRTVSYNNDVYTFGDSTFKYNTITDSWQQLTNMPTVRSEMGVAQVNGIVYCIGGYNGSPSNVNEAYNISTNSWQTRSNLPTSLTGCYAVSLNNKVYIIGGTLGTTTTYFYKYDPITDSYTLLPIPSQNRMHARLEVFNNKIYYVGGEYYTGTYGTSNHVDEYDPLTNIWTPKAPMPSSLQLPATAIYDNKMYVFGGSTTVIPPVALNTHYVYDFSLNTWTTMPTLPFTVWGMDATTNNNKIYLFGGTTPALQPSNLCYKYFCLDYFCTQIIYDTVHITVYDTLLTTITDTLVINASLTGLTPPNNLNIIKVFPNPANDHITINYGNFVSMNGYTLKIIDNLSQIVYSTQINQQSSYIDLSTWTGNGIYFVQIIDPQNNTIENRKIIIQ
jgi:N-acetylneuraminic acid mutarotase